MTTEKKKTIGKACAAVLLGWLSLLLSEFPIRFDEVYHVSFLWSLVFPIAAAWAWGKYYALLSFIPGGVFAVHFLIDAQFGYGNILYMLLDAVLLVGVGWLCGEKSRKINTYLVMLGYGVLYYFVIAFTFAPMLQLNGDNLIRYYSHSIIQVQAIMNILSRYILVFLIKILFMLPAIRKIFLLQPLPYSDNNLKSFMMVLSVFLFYLAADWTVDSFFFGSKGTHTSIFISYNGSTMKTFMVLLIVVIIADMILTNAMKVVRSRQELLKSEEQYRSIFANMIDTYIEIDCNGIVLCASPSAVDTIGYKAVSVCDKPLSSFFTESEKAELFIQRLFEKGEERNLELTSSHPYKSTKQLLITGRIIRRAVESQNIGIITIRDITEYKSAEEKRRELSATTDALFESIHNLIFVVDSKDFRLVSCNRAFRTFIREERQMDAVTDTRMDIYLTKTEAEFLHSLCGKVLEKGMISTEFVTESDQNIWEISLYPIFLSPDRTYISVIAQNVTVQRQNEKKILAMNESLEELVSERTKALETAYKDLEFFSYTVTHEFKTPIREIDAYLSIIAEDNETTLLEESKKDIVAVKRVCSETLDMIGKIMLYSRAGYMPLNIEKIDMNKLVKDCFDEVAVSQETPNSLTCYQLPPLEADAFLMKIAITNIISNSFKFSRNKGKVQITCGCIVSEKEICYYFADKGIGYSAENAQSLFGLYNRAHNSDFEGSGIGLAIVKKVVVRCGGNVDILGKEEHGCCVVLSFDRSLFHN